MALTDFELCKCYDINIPGKSKSGSLCSGVGFLVAGIILLCDYKKTPKPHF